MKKMKLFQKTYLFTVGLMAIIIIISHTLLYMLLPSFYTNKKQQDLDNISYQLTEQLQNNNSNKSDEIAKKFADMHNINILLSVNGKNKVYEGIKSCDIYINPDALDEQSLVIDNKTDFIEDNKKSNSTEVKNDFLKISDSSLLYTKKLKTKDNVDASIKVAMDLQYLQEARSVVFMILPYSIGISLIISLFASYIYTKKITKPIKQICDVTKEMQVLKEDAYCDINTGDEIELLATNINSLYKNLLDTIDSLKEEIENVSKSEKSKVDFLRSASHELKTPLMSIHIMLENMILNIGKYKNHDVYLPKCQEAVVNLSSMVQEILDTSRLNSLNGEKELKEVDLKILIESIIDKSRFTTWDFLILAQAVDGFHSRFVDRSDNKAYIKRVDELLSKFSDVQKIKDSKLDSAIVRNSRHYYSHFLCSKKDVKYIVGDVYMSKQLN